MSDDSASAPSRVPARAGARTGPGRIAVPGSVARLGDAAARRWIEFFAADIRNGHTRAAYARAAGRLLGWLDDHGLDDLRAVGPVHVAAWVEERIRDGARPPTVKQELAAVRRLFDWLVVGQALASNPAAAVRGPAHAVRTGRTAVLTGPECRRLLDSIPEDAVAGLRDRALIALMTYAFARVSAALLMNVRDAHWAGGRLWVRLREKGGGDHRLPCHHNLEAWLLAYVDAAGIAGEPGGPLFRSLRRGRLTTRRLARQDAFEMVRRRARAASIATRVCNHTFRATGLTAYLEHPEARLEVAQRMAGHGDPKTTRLYDRRDERVSLDEVERIGI